MNLMNGHGHHLGVLVSRGDDLLLLCVVLDLGLLAHVDVRIVSISGPIDVGSLVWLSASGLGGIVINWVWIASSSRLRLGRRWSRCSGDRLLLDSVRKGSIDSLLVLI